MKQSRTLKETPARPFESFSKETRETISQIISEGYRFRKHTIEYRDQWEGTWHFLRDLTSEEKAYYDFLNAGRDGCGIICPKCDEMCKYDAGTKEVAPAHFCSDCDIWLNQGEYVWQPDEEVF